MPNGESEPWLAKLGLAELPDQQSSAFDFYVAAVKKDGKTASSDCFNWSSIHRPGDLEEEYQQALAVWRKGRVKQ